MAVRGALQDLNWVTKRRPLESSVSNAGLLYEKIAEFGLN
jgi:hypothetical protein